MNFNVELCVTDRCNLKCPYCYVANRNKNMNFETFLKSLEKIHFYMQKTKCNQFDLSFFGGEPLINFDLIKKAVPILKKDKFCSSFNIISNLTLLDKEKVEWLKENNVPVSWSFDGLGSETSRPLLKVKENIDPRNGEYFKNILELYQFKKDLIFQLVKGGCKVIIYPGNCKDLVENYKFFLSLGIFHPDFSLARDNIWQKEDISQFEQSIKNLADFYIEQVRSGIFSSIGFFRLAFLDSVIGLVKGKRPFTCFACTSGCSVSPEGDFYPCQRFAAKKILKFSENFNFDFFKRECDPRKFKKCQKCSLFQICNAGCNFSQFLNNNEPLDSFCELQHLIYEQTFRIVHELKNDETFKKIVEMWIKSVG